MTAYLPHSDNERKAMLAAIGAGSIDDLFSDIPQELRIADTGLPSGLTEVEVAQHLEDLAAQNQVVGSRSFLGAGYYQHHIPAAVRAVIGRTEFATSYTPYQAEVSQGTLQHIFEFQSAICELTGLDVANASMWDGPSAAAEAAFLAVRQTRREEIALSAGLHPETAHVIDTYAAGPGFPVTSLRLDPITGQTSIPTGEVLGGAGALVVQQPNFLGIIEDLEALAAAAHAAGALLVVIQNPMTLGLLESPGAQGADVVVGDVQVLGNAMSFGGPSAGYMATRQQYLRQLPGRLVGQTTDAAGRTCYTLTLQAREQHIRRAKATSNICSNQALNALAAIVHLALLGSRGLAELGEICVTRAHWLQRRLIDDVGAKPLANGPFFHEFAVNLPEPAQVFTARMRTAGFEAGVPLTRWFPAETNGLLVAVTEMNTPADLAAYMEEAQR